MIHNVVNTTKIISTTAITEPIIQFLTPEDAVDSVVETGVEGDHVEVSFEFEGVLVCVDENASREELKADKSDVRLVLFENVLVRFTVDEG